MIPPMRSIFMPLITTWAFGGGAMGKGGMSRRELGKVKQIQYGWFTSPWIRRIQTPSSRDLRESGALKTMGRSGEPCHRSLMAAKFRRSKLLRWTRSEFMWALKTVDFSAVLMVATHGALT